MQRRAGSARKRTGDAKRGIRFFLESMQKMRRRSASFFDLTRRRAGQEDEKTESTQKEKEGGSGSGDVREGGAPPSP